jgi:hypothetical protein
VESARSVQIEVADTTGRPGQQNRASRSAYFKLHGRLTGELAGIRLRADTLGESEVERVAEAVDSEYGSFLRFLIDGEVDLVVDTALEVIAELMSSPLTNTSYLAQLGSASNAELERATEALAIQLAKAVAETEAALLLAAESELPNLCKKLHVVHGSLEADLVGVNAALSWVDFEEYPAAAEWSTICEAHSDLVKELAENNRDGALYRVADINGAFSSLGGDLSTYQQASREQLLAPLRIDRIVDAIVTTIDLLGSDRGDERNSAGIIESRLVVHRSIETLLARVQVYRPMRSTGLMGHDLGPIQVHHLLVDGLETRDIDTAIRRATFVLSDLAKSFPEAQLAKDEIDQKYD